MSMVEAHARGEHQFAAMPGCPTCSNAELQRVRREKDDLDALREAQEGHVKMTVYANQLEHQAREQAEEIERLKRRLAVLDEWEQGHEEAHQRAVDDCPHEEKTWTCCATCHCVEIERRRKAEAWLAMATDEMKAEREGTLDLRRRFGARDDETFPEFVERLATERERMKAEAEASEHESRANRWMVRAQHAEAELAVERVRRRRNREEAIGNAKAYYAERERAKRLEQALAGWLATESLPDCRACAVLDAGLPELALRPAAPEAKESDCTCGEQWPCPLHGGPPAAPEPTPSEEKP